MSAVTTPLATANLMKPLGGIPTSGTGVPLQPTNTTNPLALPNAATPNSATPIPSATAGTPLPTAATGAGVINGGDFNNTYGVDTGSAITNLLNSESSTTANSEAQAIIAANAPNVAQGSANLNTSLAASGIGPSSSVSAIENANYQGQVAQQDQSEIAQINLQEQSQQQQLLESLLPDQKQRQTDSSGWSIFGDVMQGIGDVAGFFPGA